jgi:hypothetical protein
MAYGKIILVFRSPTRDLSRDPITHIDFRVSCPPEDPYSVVKEFGYHQNIMFEIDLWQTSFAIAIISVGCFILSSRGNSKYSCCRCGYQLDGLTSNTCPECGAQSV